MRFRYTSDCTHVHLSGRMSWALHEAIDALLTYTDPGARFSWEFKSGRWDGKCKLLVTTNDDLIFPAGLAPRVLALLQRFDVEPEIVDERPTPEIPALVTSLRDDDAQEITLFDDQQDALNAFLDDPRGCIVLPTGAGKTECAAALLATFSDARALFIVNRKGLMTQTAQRFEERLGERVGMYGGPYKDTRRRVTVAVINSLWAHRAKLMREFFPEIGTLIVDECHSISPKMWFRTLEVIPAPIRLGLSATIKEASRRLVVESYLGPVVAEGDVETLIEHGRMAVPDISILRVGGVLDDALDPDVAYLLGIVRNTQRNELIVDAAIRCVAHKFPTLILCVRIEHGEILSDMLKAHGIDAPFVYGKTPLDVLDRAKQDLESGDLPVLIASTIFDMGQNVPAARALINAAGMRSPLRTIQRAGRVLRAKSEGENTTRILDFRDMMQRTLSNQSKERERTYRRKYGETRVHVISSLDEFLLVGEKI